MSLQSPPPACDVVFVFDRVMHYHVATLRAIDRGLRAAGLTFGLLSAQDREGSLGRVAMRDRVLDSQHLFRLSEWHVGGFDVRYQHGLFPTIVRMNPRVVVTTSHSGTLSEWSVLHWAGRRHIRRVAWQCGYEYNPGPIKRTVLGRFIPMFDFHLCYHSNAKAYALQHGASEGQVEVMHNTIDESRIQPMPKDEARRALEARHPGLAGKRVVLYVGAVLEEKRIELVMDALVRLQRPDLVFLLVGDGPHLSVLKQRYAGRQDWIAAGRVLEGVGVYFDAADVFVLPGTGGLAINEAMAHRLPVISGYADGSADDLVVDGETGFRLRAGTPDELAARLRELLDDPARAAAMGQAGERRIRGELSFRSFIDRVVGVLELQHALACRAS